MRVYEAIANGLGVRMGTHGVVVRRCNNDNGRWVSVAQAATLTGIHRTTLIERMKRAPNNAMKVGSRWYLRLTFLTKIVETYRYGKLGTRNGKWWSDEELQVIAKPLHHLQAAQMLDRSYNAVKVKRSKLCNHVN